MRFVPVTDDDGTITSRTLAALASGAVMSTRAVAVAAGVLTFQANKALNRMVALGLVERVSRSPGNRPSTWRLSGRGREHAAGTACRNHTPGAGVAGAS